MTGFSDDRVDPATADLVASLVLRGASAEVIDVAEADGRLHLLAAEYALIPGARNLTRAEAAAAAGVDEEVVVSFWRAAGFAEVPADAAIYTQADVEAFTLAGRLFSVGAATNVSDATALARVYGASMARIADAEIGFMRDLALIVRTYLSTAGTPDPMSDPLNSPASAGIPPEALGFAVELLLPDVEALLSFVHRRHLLAAAQRQVLRQSGSRAGLTESGVGFADLVGFTRRSRQLDPSELAELLERFEATVYDVIGAGGGRVVKLIGDEVLFVCDDPASLVRIALELLDVVHAADDLGDLRVGLAFGEMLSRDGDVHGTVVNLAHRLTNEAYPGTAIASVEVAEATVDIDEFRWRKMRSRKVAGLGSVTPWAVHRRRPSKDSGEVRHAADAPDAAPEAGSVVAELTDGGAEGDVGAGEGKVRLDSRSRRERRRAELRARNAARLAKALEESRRYDDRDERRASRDHQELQDRRDRRERKERKRRDDGVADTAVEPVEPVAPVRPVEPMDGDVSPGADG